MDTKNSDETARNRKLQLTDFKDLFCALFKINDKAVQDRVLAAINGIVNPPNCICSTKKTNIKSISTQTDSNIQLINLLPQTVSQGTTSTLAPLVIRNLEISESGELRPIINLENTSQMQIAESNENFTIESNGELTLESNEELTLESNEQNATKSNEEITFGSSKQLIFEPHQFQRVEHITIELKEEMTLDPSETLEALEFEPMEDIIVDDPEDEEMIEPEDQTTIISNEELTIGEMPKENETKDEATGIIFVHTIEKKKTHSNEKNDELPSRKRRKRDKRIPRVEKTIPNDNAIFKVPSPKIMKKSTRAKEEVIINREIKNLNINEITDCDKILMRNSPASCSNQRVDKTTILEAMKIELKTSRQMIDTEFGFYPIHKAIKENDSNKLKRQLFVFGYLKANILELVTESLDDPIQLAIKCNSMPKIFNMLFNFIEDKTECFETVDNTQNTILHLCILNTDFDIKNFKIVLNNLNAINDLYIFQHKNDNGLTVLHLATLNKNALMLHLMLIKIDHLLNLISDVEYKGLFDFTDKQLKKYYEKKIQSFADRELSKFNMQKYKIVNSIEIKSGRNALFFALQGKDELLSLILLSHLCDPSKKDYSGALSVEMNNNTEETPIIRVGLQNVESYLNKCKNRNPGKSSTSSSTVLKKTK